METEPHVIGIDELAALLDEQEAIGKTLPPGNNQVEMDNLILDEILAAQGSSMEVKVEVKTTKQSGLFRFILTFFK